MIKYIVKARLAKNIGTDDFTFESFEREFRDDENPIYARKEAFQHYFSILDIMGAGENDFKFIQENIDSSMEVITKSPGRYSDYNYNFVDEEGNLNINIPGGELGLGIYFIVDEDIEYPYVRVDGGCMILGNKGTFDYLQVEHNLEGEYIFYSQNKLDTENWTTTIKYWDFSDNSEEPIFQEVLWTPFDFWTNWNPQMKRAYDVINKENENAEPEVNSIFTKIIQKGENQNLELKSTLRYCLKTNKPREDIEHTITKTIAAFANTKGGLLLIGVADDGEILGLENDISTFSKPSKDSFLKHFDNLMRNHFSLPIYTIIKFGFEEVSSKSIFRIEVGESLKPRFLTTKLKGNEFYIRGASGSESLNIEKAVAYILDKWYARD